MTHVPGSAPFITSPFVTPYSFEGFSGVETARHLGVPSSATYPAANRAYYYPIVIPSPCTIYRFFWLNGATASTNNFQVGIYYDDTDGPGDSYLLGTSTLASGANVCQFDNVTDTAIGPGRWWLAIWGSGTTATLFRTSIGSRSLPGYLQSSIAGGLPSNATPAANTSQYCPIFGFTTVSSP